MEEKVLLNATVCLVIKNNQVLLGLKTKKIGAGRRNGYGGGIEDGESIKEATIRELEEETGKKVGNIFITTSQENLEKVAVVYFENTKSDGTSFVCRVHFFIVRKWEGEAIETDEMIDPKFFDIGNLPLNEMLPADSEYFPLILQGKKVIAKAKYGPYQKELLGPVFIEEVSSFDEN
jgi:8-oxo-dGTP pyrophosphatase MutT (NUDIX family)